MKNAFLFFLTLLFAGVAHANLIVNGGFETPDASASPYYISLDGTLGNELPGWTVTTNAVDVVDFNGIFNKTGTAYEGTQVLDLVGSGSTGRITQTFATTPGQTYSLSFAYSANPYSGFNESNPATADVKVQGENPLVTQSISSSNAGSDPLKSLNWTLFNATFTADSATTTLSFLETFGQNNGGILLDAVSVTAVPVPAAFWLLFSALSALGLIRRSAQPSA